MSRLGRRLLVVAAGALLAALTARQGIAGCVPVNAKAPPAVPLSSLSIKTPVFKFEHGGRFLKGDLVSGKWAQISNHDFDYIPQIVPSTDGRWISYSGELKGVNSAQYWLYDKHTGRDRLYHQHPGVGEIPGFSPNSKTIALSVDFGLRGSPAGFGLYLIDAETLRSSFLGNPSRVATFANRGFASTAWSKDGSELLIMMIGLAPGVKAPEEYFAYRVAEKRFERISGDYDEGRSEEKFFRGGARIAVHEQRYPQSHRGYQELASPSGRWIASIDRAHVLTVKAREDSGKSVDVGRYDHCMGVTIFINGWLESRYLVYSVEDATYIYDAMTGRKAVLFSGKNHPAAFFW